ncbi:MAG: class I SAM-dependent methyltransferase [Candidatus Omnitrophica bacterium]|nr:class I SAM-dependent methyltransferase [Candidatus Omnitrophota bacterium]
MKSIFDRNCKKFDAWYDKNPFAYLSELKVLKKVIPARGRGLEIGVGTGRFAAPLGIRYGVDPSKKMLAIAAKRGVRVRSGYGEKLPFRDSFFDYVAIIITLCFVKDPYRVLIEARRVLKKGGKILIGIIDKESFLGKYYRKKKSIFYAHANFFSIQEVGNQLKGLGFRRISYYQSIYTLPCAMRAIQRPARGFGRGGFVVLSAIKQYV